MGKAIYELPAGGIHEDKTLMRAALRELEEETGYTTYKLEWIGRFSRAPSNIAGIVDMFFTKALKQKGKLDPEKIMNIELSRFLQSLE